MNAEDRAWELMNLPIKDLPPLANQYAHYLCGKVGGCMEVLLTAYAHYVQVVENLKPSDKAYEVDKDGRKWFKEHQW